MKAKTWILRFSAYAAAFKQLVTPFSAAPLLFFPADAAGRCIY